MPPAMTPPSTCRPPGSRTPRQSGAPRVPYQKCLGAPSPTQIPSRLRSTPVPTATPGPTMTSQQCLQTLPPTSIARAHPRAPRPARPRNYAAMPLSQGPRLQLRAHPRAAWHPSMSASLRRTGELQHAERLTSGHTQTQGATHTQRGEGRRGHASFDSDDARSPPLLSTFWGSNLRRLANSLRWWVTR
jgi:hypothetical protein